MLFMQQLSRQQNVLFLRFLSFKSTHNCLKNKVLKRVLFIIGHPKV